MKSMYLKKTYKGKEISDRCDICKKPTGVVAAKYTANDGSGIQDIKKLTETKTYSFSVNMFQENCSFFNICSKKCEVEAIRRIIIHLKKLEKKLVKK